MKPLEIAELEELFAGIGKQALAEQG